MTSMINYRNILYSNYSSSFGKQKALNDEIQYANYEETYRDLPSNHDIAVVDIGCGKGEWLSWMFSKGYKLLIGVDSSPSDIAIARDRINQGLWVEMDAIQFLHSKESAYDLIHAKDIVEHFTKEEFMRFLMLAMSALKPGGTLWLLTFNAQSPLASSTRYGDFTHEIGLTPSSAAQCLRACGYDDIRIRGLHYCSPTIHGFLRRTLGAIFYAASKVAIQIRHGRNEPDGSIDQFCSLPDLFIIARKPE